MSSIQLTMVDGEVLMQDFALVHLDAHAIAPRRATRRPSWPSGRGSECAERELGSAVCRSYS